MLIMLENACFGRFDASSHILDVRAYICLYGPTDGDRYEFRMPQQALLRSRDTLDNGDLQHGRALIEHVPHGPSLPILKASRSPMGSPPWRQLDQSDSNATADSGTD